MKKSTIVKIPKASELVAATLRRQIVTGELKPGELLPNEAILMQQFGVSRPTLREAFRILESEAIITVLRGARGGGRVLEPDGAVAARYMGILLQYQGTPLTDVYQARTEIEVSAVGMLGGSKRRSAIRTLGELAAEAEELVDDDDAFAAHDLKIHSAIVEATGNMTLAELSKMLFHIIDAHNALFIASHPRGSSSTVNKQAQRAYARLVKLLSDGDFEAAQRHWRRYLEAAETFMVGEADSTLIEVLS
ncbi:MULTISPECIES: FadR/GntR family transcriptional regulator [Mycobacterium]|uniref:GntR family transcriptional regulator n=1 Tax=Mycobacterium paraseoulense TaxID=590652 RepID=A0A1X0IF21_9MYCO|nr:GntR family transcriptional regulator [Mycobacterium paraseoulense]MCV7393805.1 FadR family transcriptional regulator [Mycobacterium paraseoulense]ORB45460.1 GntR family transcriptional regulator [Mycobacterium paraseoulense]BBZ70578.1 GntR family transcriptional regulator [Mycobacterium paraseoulense]